MKVINYSLLAGVLLYLLPTPGLAAGSSPEGTWRMTNGKITVKVEYCSDQNLCATIVGMAKPLDKQGRPKTDKENPDPSLRERPVIGLMVISGMRPDGRNRWSGELYNADDGRTYNATARLEDEKLQVKGCVLFFCKKLRFNRVGQLPAEQALQQ